MTSRNTPTKKLIDKKDGVKEHFDVRINYNLETHCSKVDESFIDYILDSENGSFIVYFDQALYEAPTIILNLQAQLEKQEEEKKAKK